MKSSDHRQRRNAWGERETGEKISKEWYKIKTRKTSALWEQRHDVHKGCVVPASELRAQVAEAVKARRMRKAETRTNHNYLKMTRNSLRTFWSRNAGTNLEHPLQDLQSVQRKATKKRQIANLARHNRRNAPRNAKNKGSARKTRRKQQRKDLHISTRCGIPIRN